MASQQVLASRGSLCLLATALAFLKLSSVSRSESKTTRSSKTKVLSKAKRRAKEVVCPDGLLLKISGDGSLNLKIQLLQEELLEIKRSSAELVDAHKRMTVRQKIKSSAKAIEANPSTGPPTTLSLRSRNRKYCDFCKM